ncbi:PREDICTED: putative defensin-like protein 165 [Tarenaya hassleriana]|uniref:putative defensin-like protein 165 n=1 Tax=Tarenaya hassleriana TaxID=28532 RepID=UPI0008FCED6F|nr:PREDICTED: putative defensin-like protein 165 [Tarenaya hassleriana]
MANKPYSYFLVLLISVLVVLSGTEAQSRCIEELDPTAQCELSQCRAKCFKKNGFGSCIEKPLGSDQYVCTCVYNCGPSSF